MIPPSLLHEPLMRSEVVNRRQPPRSFLALVFDWLRGAEETLLYVADAVLMPERERAEKARAER